VLWRTVVSWKSVYTVIVCNYVWSNKSSCQSNTPCYNSRRTRDNMF
jgi:hypothetical protein